MTNMTAKMWLDAMMAEGKDIDQEKMNALDEAMTSLSKQVAIKARADDKGVLYCPLCFTKMGFNNQRELANYCLECGQRLVPDFEGRNSNGEFVDKKKEG